MTGKKNVKVAFRKQKGAPEEYTTAIKQLGIILLCVVILVAVPVIAFGGDDINPFKRLANSSEEPITPPAEPMDPVDIQFTFVGDCTLGADQKLEYSKSLPAYYDSRGPDYFFQNVRQVFEEDDLTIINMEGTLTTSNERKDKTFAFKAPPEYVSILTNSSVELANLANNHSEDYGKQSYEETITTLESADIGTFGHDRTLIVDVKGIKVGLMGVTTVEKSSVADEVTSNMDALKSQGAQLIIANFHWGVEGDNYPISWQQELAYIAIDAGADLVIGHHPHVLQGIERYKDKNIVYSLGNFCFGGNSNPVDKDTMIYQQTFTITENGVELNDKSTIIPCSLSSTSEKNDFCPIILEGSEKDRVLEKINQFSAGIEPFE